MAAKVPPALPLTGSPADDGLDVVTVLLHTTALRGNRWELDIPMPFPKPGAPPQSVATVNASTSTLSHEAINSSSVSVFPGLRVTQAFTISPHFGSGIPKTAA